MRQSTVSRSAMTGHEVVGLVKHNTSCITKMVTMKKTGSMLNVSVCTTVM